MRFIEIADEEALNLPADQLKAIATYNYLLLSLIHISEPTRH